MSRGLKGGFPIAITGGDKATLTVFLSQNRSSESWDTRSPKYRNNTIPFFEAKLYKCATLEHMKLTLIPFVPTGGTGRNLEGGV